MRSLIRIIGNLFIAVAVLGSVLLVLGPPSWVLDALEDPPPSPPAAVGAPVRTGSSAALATPASAANEGRSTSRGPLASSAVATPAGNQPAATAAVSSSSSAGPLATAAPTPMRATPITRVFASKVGLDSEVVAARLIEKNGAITWEIPAHRAGHAEQTAGAGDRGNAVLLGHVSSIRSGDVFKDIGQLAPGDTVEIYSDARKFTYRVTRVFQVDRKETSPAETTDVATVTLITCSGLWLPTIWDYTERTIVRAELVTG